MVHRVLLAVLGGQGVGAGMLRAKGEALARILEEPLSQAGVS